jgi:arylsulfatase A-like enzyme
VDVPHYPGPGPAGCYVAPWHFPPALGFTGEPGEHIEDRMAREAVRFIKESKAASRPFFLNYWAFSVHAPFDAKKALVEEYTRKVDPKNPQRCPVYAAMVKSLDDAVGTLIKTLEEEGLAENTIVIFTSDNGGNMYDRVDGITPTSNAPLRGGKATLYEGGTREPLVVVWPGKVRPGTRNERDLAQSIDFYPTLLEMTGAQPAPGQQLDGVSLVPALTGGALKRDAIFCHFPHDVPATDQRPGSWVRRGDWKLIRLYCEGPGQQDRFELYNLKDDLGETQDLATRMPEKVKELGALLDGFLKTSGAVVPVANPRYDPACARPATKRKANTASPVAMRKGAVKKKGTKQIQQRPNTQNDQAR